MSPASTRICFLGGVGEIGRNMTVFEHEGAVMILDVGLMFPTEEMLGVDLVLPDFEYVRAKADQIVGIVLTHGHEDHVGGLPYLLREMQPPIYGTRLTLGLLKPKLEEHGLIDDANLNEIASPGSLQIGPFSLTFNRVCHSIPDGVSTLIETPAARILHTGDFRFDPTPIDGKVTDLEGIAAAVGDGVDLLLSDSTNAERPGAVPSERLAGEAIAKVIERAQGRVVVACFASNLHRIQQIADAAMTNGRYVAFLGRSMHTNVRVARELGYMDIDDDKVILIEDVDDYPPEKVVVISTGSQGEPLSALSLMAAKDHKWIDLEASDTVIISATPIPGNESAVRRVIDGLFRIGCEVVHPPEYQVHTSGHAASDELRSMLELVRPKWFIPVHGEYRQLATHVRIATDVGIPEERTMIVTDGDIVEIGDGEMRHVERIHAGYTFVDGLGIGDVHDVVLRDRRLLAGDGIVVAVVTIDSQNGELVAGPDLISRGFLHEDAEQGFFEGARAEIRASLASLAEDEISDWTIVRRHVRRALGRYVWEHTRRRPIILPVVMEV